MKKRLLSWLLAISMLTAAMPTAFAEGDAAATEPAPVSMSDVTEEHSEPAGDVIVEEEETEPETPEDTSEEPAADSTVASVPTETNPAE